MNSASCRHRDGSLAESRDAGFSLIEVVVALFLIGLVAAGALLFFVRGMQNTSHLQRTQAATTIATQGMELVRAVDARATTGTSGLLIGRSKGDVQAVWNAADPADIAETSMAWDKITPSADPTKQSVRLVRTTTVSDMDYTIVTLIGECYRSGTASSAKQACTAAKPAAPVLMYRATVIVEWKAGKDGQCDAGACSYRLTSLIDPTTDASWNLSAKPVAYDDAATFSAGDPVSMIDILANDVITTVTSNPTAIISPISSPTMGSVSVIPSGTKMGAVNYTPPSNYSGPVSFTYKLRDAQGRNSNEAIVAIAVLPRAVDDTATAPRGSTVSLPVSANDRGSLASVVIKTQPARGSVTAAGSNITFTSSASTGLGSVTFTYAQIDASGQESLPATVTLTISEAAPTASDIVIPDIMSSATATTNTLPIQALTGNPATYKVIIVSGPTPADGTPASSVGTLSGSGTATIAYVPKINTLGTLTFTFQVQNGSGPLSEVRTAQIRMVPRANAYTHGSTVTAAGKATIIVRTGNSPSAIDTTGAVTYATDGVVTCTAGGNVSAAASVTLPTAGDGSFAFTAPRWSNGSKTGSCTFKYTMTWTQYGQTFTTPAALVTVPVTR